MPETSGATFQEVLNELGIVRVICIDDIYDSRVDREAILAWGMLSTNFMAMAAIIKSLGQSLDLSSDTANAELRTLLNENVPFAVEVQARIDRVELDKKSPAPLSDEKKQLFTDRSVLSRLDEIMKDFGDFRRLAPTQWLEMKTGLLPSLADTKTLFIFDEYLGPEMLTGTEHINEMAGSEIGGDGIYCLLTYTIASGTEHEHTRDLQARGIPATAISKRDLSDATGFIQLRDKLRHVVLWAESKELREACKAALVTAHTNAHDRVHALTPQEFDEVFFRSSYREGVHVMDTLVRVYTNAFAASLRETLRSNVTALGYIDKLRRLRGAGEASVSNGSTAWKLQRDEYYDSGPYINSCKMPPEAGDIYKITADDGNTTEYVLVALSAAVIK